MWHKLQLLTVREKDMEHRLRQRCLHLPSLRQFLEDAWMLKFRWRCLHRADGSLGSIHVCVVVKRGVSHCTIGCPLGARLRSRFEAMPALGETIP